MPESMQESTQESTQESAQEPAQRVELRVDGVRKRLGARRVVDEVSFTCAGGEICVLTGPNGAGKSTLLKMIAGIMEPDAGTIELRVEPPGGPRGQPGGELDGQALAARTMNTRKRLGDTRKCLGYVPEAANPPGHMTGAELFALVCALKRAQPLAPSMHAALGLEAIARVRIERLSLGERRRVCLGAALIGEPLLLVLDEPTNGLDASGVDTLAELLCARRDAGAAILLATHDSSFADRVADTRLRMQQGRLAPA